MNTPMVLRDMVALEQDTAKSADPRNWNWQPKVNLEQLADVLADGWAARMSVNMQQDYGKLS